MIRKEVDLIIITLPNGIWKFTIKEKMNEEEIRKLIKKIKYVELELSKMLKTNLIQITDNIEELQEI